MSEKLALIYLDLRGIELANLNDFATLVLSKKKLKITQGRTGVVYLTL